MTDHTTAESASEHSSAGFSVTVRLKIENVPGNFASITSKIAESRASLAEVTLRPSTFTHKIRDVTFNCCSEEHARSVISTLEDLPNATLIDWQDDTLAMHLGGKLRIAPTSLLHTADELSRAYTPGVARVCNRIHADPNSAFTYTIKRNSVAVVSDGTAVLGLGDIGPRAAMPVMEGKAVLFKQFADVDAYPICLDTKDTEEIIRTVKYISPGFGGINLEDISAPRCFEIEQRLRAELDIPVFHDDQHGTAVVVLAGLINACKITGKKLKDLRVVFNGFGASGVACARILHDAGVQNIVPCDSVGIVYKGRERLNSVKEELLQCMNLGNEKGTVADAMRGADVFIGVSKPGTITREMVKTMAKDAVVFALSNPIPEIMPDEIEGIARIIATGRSDYPNQVNNVLCFPGIFRGALDCNATDITKGMKLAAAHAIADSIDDASLAEDHIIPSIFGTNISSVVAERVKNAALLEGVTRQASEEPRRVERPHVKEW